MNDIFPEEWQVTRFVSKHNHDLLSTDEPLEEQGRRLFTPFAFKKFQEEFGKAIQYMVKEENKPSLRLSITKRVDCISVLVHKDCFEIPSTYWSPQWCRQEVELDESSISHQQESSIVATYLDNVDPPSVDLVHCPPRSIPKGQPKTCRLKPQKELTKQVKHAMKRKKFIKYPNKENIDGHDIA
ncbi:hypothetical protein Tco_0104590 [Tanacetum coccineum]